MKKNESNERFDEVKAKMDDCSKTIGQGLETAQAIGAEAGERISKFISGAKEKYGPKLNTLKDNVVDYYKKFVEDVDKRKESIQEEKAARLVDDKLDEAEAFFEVAKAAQERGQSAYQEAIEAQKSMMKNTVKKKRKRRILQGVKRKNLKNKFWG